MQRVVVVGGGISGLAAAHAAREEARERGLALEVVVLEAAGDVGGKATTVARDGWIVETGPTGFLDNEPVLDRLVEASGLTKLPAQAAAARRYVVRGGRLREIKAHPLEFAKSGILSPLGLARIAAEPLVRARRDGADESVWEFARRRLGAQAADRLIAPMVLGVFAGDARRISLPAAFPRMAELERDYGGLFRAMRALKRERGAAAGGPAGPSGTLTSFAGGLQRLPQALARGADITVRTGARVAGLAWEQGTETWRVRVADAAESLAADAVILAIEPWIAAELLVELAPAMARELTAIQCPPVAVVALGYEREALERAPQGFGALIPRHEGYRTLGVLWDTHLFADRSAEGTLLMRAMLGGATDPGVGALSQDDLAQIARDELGRLLGLTRAPVFQEVRLWPQAIPQYELGHLERVRTIESALTNLAQTRPGLHLAGNYLHGVAFGKAAAHGWLRGRQAVSALAAQYAEGGRHLPS